ncbi:FAD-binding oxidoreductase [Winogradskya consettensis]|nr:FAD-linked oxidase C-terminal domain-containing protein [Actinoplanes consettensis]
MAPYLRDEAFLCGHGTPLAVVRAHTTREVAAAVRVAAAHGLPVVPQGARSGLTGAANAVDGAIVISLTAMDRIIAVDAAERTAVVQPGVITATLRETAAQHGLVYPPDPGSWQISTIGGNVATNAGGMCCVKYGVTGEYVLGLEVVLADGEILRCGRRTAKGVAGYDLTSLFTGSEGTLGIITEITVRLRPPPGESRTVVASFASIAGAGNAVAAIIAAGMTPSLLELLDRNVLRAVENYRPMGLDTTAEALLLAAVDTGPDGRAAAAAIARLCRAAGAGEVHTATDAAEAEMLFGARRMAHQAMQQWAISMFPGGDGGVIVDDVAVPRGRLVELMTGIAAIATAQGVLVSQVGHAGDGNLHPNIVINRADPASVDAGRVAFDEIVRLSLALGGTCTGEHGIGMLKTGWLAHELGPVGVRLQWAVKHALDPAGILNPGKALAPPPGENGMTPRQRRAGP